LSNDSDAEGGPLSVSSSNPALSISGGTVTINHASLSGGTSYPPTASLPAYTVYQIAYQVTDPAGASSTATLQLAVVPIGNGNANDTVNLTALASQLGGYSFSSINGANGTDALTGVAGVDTFLGGAGNDTLRGGMGSDVLTGEGGVDTFVFASTAEGVDRLTDFNATNNVNNGDVIELSAAAFANIANGSGSGAGARLSINDFASITSGNAAGNFDVSTLSVGGAANVIYDTSTGALYYDVDGGSLANAVQLATLTLTGGTFDQGDIRVGP
jgi:Ca2+-binding RTX toxin-like protein